MVGRRGQSAMEFLMTYGWAVMIMLVVVAVLFMLGVFNPQNAAPNSCVLPSGLSCFGYAVSDGGVLWLDVGQATGDDVTINAIGCSAKETDPTIIPLTNAYIASGRHVNLTGLPRCEKLDGSYPAEGQYYRGNIIVIYTEQKTGIAHRVIGDIAYRVGAAGFGS
jgi:hypothetical protein